MKHMDTAKKRRGWRQALALLITLVLVCGLAAPAYAEIDGESQSASSEGSLHADTLDSGTGTQEQTVISDTQKEINAPTQKNMETTQTVDSANIKSESAENAAEKESASNSNALSGNNASTFALLADANTTIHILQGGYDTVTRNERDLWGTSVRVSQNGTEISNSGITGSQTSSNRETVYTVSASETTTPGTYTVEFGCYLIAWYTTYTIEVTVDALHRITVSFNANGGVVEPASVSVSNESFTIGGLNVTVTPPDETQKFAGWKNAGGDSVALDTEISASEDMTFTAQWTARLKATFKNGEDSTVRYENDNGMITAPEAPTAPAGKLLSGWVDAEGNVVKANQEFSLTADNTYTAQWRDCIAVTFNPRNGSDTFTVNEDENGNVVFPAAPTAPEGQQFVGWFDDPEGTGDLNVPGSSDVAAKEGMIFYAKWEKKYDTTNNRVVSVYVAAQDQNGNPFSQEMLDLLGISFVNTSHYFPAGIVTLPDACFTGYGFHLSTSDEKWDMIISGIRNGINTDVLTGTAAQNKGHKLVQYADRIIRDTDADAVSGSQKSTLFASTYADNISVACQYHLDLRFSCNRVIFYTGNNGISSGDVKDKTELDSRVYITGSRIQDIQGEIKAPVGYTVVEGYYADPDFTIPWNKIGQPLNQDEKVYVKIVELGKVKVEYKVVGDIGGTVTSPMDQFNPETSRPAPVGSTANASEGFKFDGWYYDEECTKPITKEDHVDPVEPEGGWQTNTVHTYWAKFVPDNTIVTVSKTVTGGLGDTKKDFNFTVTVTMNDQPSAFLIGSDSYTSTGTFTLKNGDHKELTVPVGAKVVVTEEDYGEGHGGYTTTYKVNSNDAQTGLSAELTAQVGNNDTIVFTNDKEASPDTGVLLDSLPYVLILAAVAVAAVLMLSRKRRNRDAD